MKSQIEAGAPSVVEPSAPSSQAAVLAEIGHELRNPLTSILAYADALHDEVFGPLSAGQKQALLSISYCVRRQTGLIDDLLDLRRLEAGSFKAVPCRMDEIAEHARGKVADLAKSRPVHFAISVDPEGAVVLADTRSLKQAVTQLLTAGMVAVEKHGSVRLSVTLDQGLRFQLLALPPGVELTAPPAAGATDPAIERRLRKLCPTGFALLEWIFGVSGAALVFEGTAEGCLRASAFLPLEPV